MHCDFFFLISHAVHLNQILLYVLYHFCLMFLSPSMFLTLCLTPRSIILFTTRLRKYLNHFMQKSDGNLVIHRNEADTTLQLVWLVDTHKNWFDIFLPQTSAEKIRAKLLNYLQIYHLNLQPSLLVAHVDIHFNLNSLFFLSSLKIITTRCLLTVLKLRVLWFIIAR